jgi:aspartate/methionine/tyrosine aminotransferase
MFADRTHWNLAENRLSQALAAHRRNGLPLVDLAISNPTECGFDYDQHAILSAFHNPAALTYHPVPQGISSAREAVAFYYSEKGSAVSVDDIFLTTSTSEAYSYLFRLLCNPGDEVLIPTPSYPLFDFLAELNDVRLLRYALIHDHGWQTDFPSLEQVITPRTRAVIAVHPNNPTGHYAKPAEQSRFAHLCAQHELAIISDEVFLDFDLHAKANHSFAGEAKVLTFVLSGLSKISGLPQMKTSWIVVSGPAAQRLGAHKRLEIIADSYLSMNTPVQLALPGLLATRASFQQQLLNRARSNLSALDAQLTARPSCSRLAVEGGWNVVVRVPATQSDEEFAISLLSQQGVLVHPGHFYDFPQEGHLVLSLITPQAQFADGVRRLLSICC